MYFLTQIKTQFFAQIAPYYDAIGENGAGRVDEVTDLSEADTRLGVLEATTKIAGTELEVILRGLERIAAATPEEKQDPEFKALLVRVDRLRAILLETKREGMQIDGVLRQSIHEVREGIAEVQAVENREDESLSPEELQNIINLLKQEEEKKSEYVDTIQSTYIRSINLETASQEIKDLVEKFGSIQGGYPEDIQSSSEKLDYIRLQNRELDQLIFDFETQVRDEQKIGENGETLGNIRKSLVEEKFNALKESGIEKQKQIIGESTFENLRTDQLTALARNGVNLGEFMLVDSTGKAFSGTFEANQEFVFNTGGRDDFGGYALAYIFDIDKVESINVAGVVYSRDTQTPSQGFVDTNGLPLSSLRDGELVKIVSVKTLDDTTSAAVQSAVQQSYYNDRSASLTDEFSQNLEANGFDLKTFLDALLSGNGQGILSQLEHLVNGRFQQDSETGAYSQYDQAVDEHIPLSPANMSLASLESFPQSYRRNLVNTCSDARISVDDFVAQMNQECQTSGFPPQRFIALIGHESGWRSSARNPTSSAYGLGQMIDSTWGAYSGGGNRNNPIDQMKASLRYLKHIMQVRGCSAEDACAFYNTGEGFEINDGPAPSSYVRQNGVIVDKIPAGLRANGVTSREYFIGAVAYYNDINFEEAQSRSRFG